ncbi:MAG: hypothetical protein K9I68_06915 [Bacteroidales bacterium]|nr:hypothetical protein [Bacteroidales bacterium]MCF8338297.1 hypothetical protein [Bacteroidales bacterium]
MKHFNIFLKTLLLGGFFALISLNSAQAQHWSVDGQSIYDTWSIYLDDILIDGSHPSNNDQVAVFSGTTLKSVKVNNDVFLSNQF